MECSYCKSVLTTKGSLKFHQNNVRSCLQIQDNIKLQQEINKQRDDFEKTKDEITLNHTMNHQKEVNEILMKSLDRGVEEKQPPRQMDTIFSWTVEMKNGEIIDIPMREDGYMNLTVLCKAGGKKFGDWYKNENSKQFIRELEFETKIIASQLLTVNKYGKSYEQGTWGHPDIAIQVAQWISPWFSLKVSACIRQLFMTGSVSLDNTKSSKDLDKIQYEKQQKLRNEISIDISLYKEMDIIYLGIFTPNYEYLTEEEIEEYEEGNISYNVLGYSKNICNRVSGYKSDKNFGNFKITHIFLTKNTAVSEKRLKTITSDMSLTINYIKHKECFKSTSDELKLVAEYIEEHIDNLNENKSTDMDNLDLEKYKIDAQNAKYKIELDAQNDRYKLDLDAKNDSIIRIETMFKDGLISFDQMMKMIQ
jgi:hypothetical protein